MSGDDINLTVPEISESRPPLPPSSSDVDVTKSRGASSSPNWVKAGLVALLVFNVVLASLVGVLFNQLGDKQNKSDATAASQQASKVREFSKESLALVTTHVAAEQRIIQEKAELSALVWNHPLCRKLVHNTNKTGLDYWTSFHYNTARCAGMVEMIEKMVDYLHIVQPTDAEMDQAIRNGTFTRLSPQHSIITVQHTGSTILSVDNRLAHHVGRADSAVNLTYCGPIFQGRRTACIGVLRRRTVGMCYNPITNHTRLCGRGPARGHLVMHIGDQLPTYYAQRGVVQYGNIRKLNIISCLIALITSIGVEGAVAGAAAGAAEAGADAAAAGAAAAAADAGADAGAAAAAASAASAATITSADSLATITTIDSVATLAPEAAEAGAEAAEAGGEAASEVAEDADSVAESEAEEEGVSRSAEEAAEEAVDKSAFNVIVNGFCKVIMGTLWEAIKENSKAIDSICKIIPSCSGAVCAKITDLADATKDISTNKNLATKTKDKGCGGKTREPACAARIAKSFGKDLGTASCEFFSSEALEALGVKQFSLCGKLIDKLCDVMVPVPEAEEEDFKVATSLALQATCPNAIAATSHDKLNSYLRRQSAGRLRMLKRKVEAKTGSPVVWEL